LLTLIQAILGVVFWNRCTKAYTLRYGTMKYLAQKYVVRALRWWFNHGYSKDTCWVTRFLARGEAIAKFSTHLEMPLLKLMYLSIQQSVCNDPKYNAIHRLPHKLLHEFSCSSDDHSKSYTVFNGALYCWAFWGNVVAINLVMYFLGP
jgi:hypothetical protein